MHINAKLYDRLKCLSRNDWKEICRDFLGVDLIDEVTVHEGEKVEGYHYHIHAVKIVDNKILNTSFLFADFQST